MAKALIDALVIILIGLIFLPLVASFAAQESKDKNLTTIAQGAVAVLPVVYVLIILLLAFGFVTARGKAGKY